MADIKIGGKLRNVQDPNGVIADASQITYDENSSVSDKLKTIPQKADIEKIVQESGLSTPYSEADGSDIDYISTNGYYKLTNAKNYPEGTSANGYLSVSVLDKSEQLKQVWESNGFSASRYAKYDNAVINESNVKVLDSEGNEVEQIWDGTTLYLEAGSTYTLSGYVYGNIVIHSTAEDQTTVDTTVLKLNGLSIYSPSTDRKSVV